MSAAQRAEMEGVRFLRRHYDHEMCPEPMAWDPVALWSQRTEQASGR